MLTLQSVIGDSTATAFARELAGIAGAPCTVQKVSNWVAKGSVPASWLPPIIEYLRRRGTEPTVDDLAGLCPRPVILLHNAKGNMKGGQSAKNGKASAVVSPSELSA